MQMLRRVRVCFWCESVLSLAQELLRLLLITLLLELVIAQSLFCTLQPVHKLLVYCGRLGLLNLALWHSGPVLLLPYISLMAQVRLPANLSPGSVALLPLDRYNPVELGENLKGIIIVSKRV
jgi:hypothetical protein